MNKFLMILSALAISSLSCTKRDGLLETTIPQDNVMRSRSCGSGCSIKTKQLSYPEAMEDGWIRVKAERTIKFFNRQGNEFTFRGTPSGTKEEVWLFADCDRARFTFSTQPNRSEIEAFPSQIERRADPSEESVYYSDGTPKVHNPIGNTWIQWSKLCPKEAHDESLTN